MRVLLFMLENGYLWEFNNEQFIIEFRKLSKFRNSLRLCYKMRYRELSQCYLVGRLLLKKLKKVIKVSLVRNIV